MSAPDIFFTSLAIVFITFSLIFFYFYNIILIKILTLFKCTLIIPSLSSIFGISIYIFVSNLPDLNNASSKLKILLVAAITTIFSYSANPSISVKS